MMVNFIIMNVVNVDIAKNQKSQNYKRELMITREMEEKAHAAGRKNAKSHQNLV